ncbi:MAG TPA: DUF5777 family beta-barrel protein [Thermoanaerobaculia bacterium]|jgi:hypothetical protein
MEMKAWRMRTALLLSAIGLSMAAAGVAQDAQNPAQAEPQAAEKKDPSDTAVRYLPIEGPTIINLPSVEVPRQGTLSVLFTHRFVQAVQNSSPFHDLVSFDNGASIGIGLAYAPLKNLNLGFYRSSESGLDPWEISGQYQFLPSDCPIGASLRVGADIRSERNLTDRTSVFAQLPLAYSWGQRFRITAVPTYVTKVNGTARGYNPSFTPPSFPPPNDESCVPNGFGGETCTGLYRNVFNVPVGVSVAVTRSITLHGEIAPRLGRYDAPGVAWSASIEKSLLRHRFCFVAGNQRQTTVDQYATGIPWGSQYTADKVNGVKGVYLGFNISRQWKVM